MIWSKSWRNIKKAAESKNYFLGFSFGVFKLGYFDKMTASKFIEIYNTRLSLIVN